MRSKQKLQALLNTCRQDVKKAVEYKTKVDDVVNERQGIVNQLADKKERLLRALKKFRTKARQAALRSSNARQLCAVGTYENRLVKEIAKLNEILAQKEAELKRALDRLQVAERELVEARVQQKKVEQLLDQRAHAERIEDIAREEAQVDELTSYRR